MDCRNGDAVRSQTLSISISIRVANTGTWAVAVISAPRGSRNVNAIETDGGYYSGGIWRCKSAGMDEVKKLQIFHLPIQIK